LKDVLVLPSIKDKFELELLEVFMLRTDPIRLDYELLPQQLSSLQQLDWRGKFARHSTGSSKTSKQQ